MNIFNQKIRVDGIRKNKFDLSHERKLTLNMGHLVPILLQEVVPGDSFRVNTEVFLRFAPMIAPVLHRIDVYTHYFYVPNRIVWDNFDDFITKEGPGVPVKVPQLIVQAAGASGLMDSGSLADYLGLPTVEGTGLLEGIAFSQLPFRAYKSIYNEYYRDQTLMPAIDFPTDDADVIIDQDPVTAAALMALETRSWEKDYFTTALPNPQYTDSAAIAPITPLDSFLLDNGTLPAAGNITTTGIGGQLSHSVGGAGVIASAGSQPGTLIEDLRKANTLQLWLEKQARGGQRLVETILSHFGVRVPDARVSRPEYLGGGKQSVTISEVLSTFDNTAADRPQGTMSGHGISSGRTHGFSHTFPEHGYVIGIMSVLPKAAYQQGINRHWTRGDKFDFYWPTFAHLGEQEVKNKELYYDGTSALNEQTFGYQMRYSEYKYQPDTVHGDFRNSLAYWHLGRIFAARPALNSTFVKADTTNFDRIFAVDDPAVHKLWCQVYNQVDALRPMPVFGTPRL